MKELVQVAAVQLDVAWLDPKANVERMLALGEEAVQAGPVDVLVYPELSNVGYVTERDPAFAPQYMELAESIPGPTTEVLGGFARQHGVWIVVGLCEMHSVVRPSVYNSAVLIGPSGEVVGKHRKAHLPAEEKHYFYRGRSLDVWDTELGRVGLAVCYDALFPETLRVLALRGAEIVFCPFNVPREHLPPDVLVHLTRTRALENRAFVIACNRVGEQPGLHFFGGSAIADPAGALLALGDDKESILRATLRRDTLVQKRAFHTHFQDRRPDLYGPLVEGD